MLEANVDGQMNQQTGDVNRTPISHLVAIKCRSDKILWFAMLLLVTHPIYFLPKSFIK